MKFFARGFSSFLATVAIVSVAHADAPDFSRFESSSLHIIQPSDCENGETTDHLEALTRNRLTLQTPARGNISPALSTRLGSHGPQLAFGLTNWMEWTPNAALDRTPDPGCSAQDLEAAVLAAQSSVSGQSDAIARYFQRCDASLRVGHPDGIRALIGVETTHYDFCQHPNIRKVVMHLPDGQIVRGVLAVKSGAKTRPMVIAKCGVICDTGGAAQRFLLMHLFDESPFNVLAIGNVTGPSFIRDNGFIAFGGFYEGQQIIEIAKLVRANALATVTSSLHLVGVSLGGHASLFASFLNAYNLQADGHPLLDSTLAACPVVNLQASFDGLFSSPIKGFVARKVYDRLSQAILQAYPKLQTVFPPTSTPDAQLPEALAASAVTHLKDLPIGWALPPFAATTVTTTNEFWAANVFMRFVANPSVTPTLVFAATDDQVVSEPENSGALQAALQGQAGDAGGANANLAVSILPSGNHCAFNMVYGWQISSSLFRAYVRSHSPELMSDGNADQSRRATIALAANRTDSATSLLQPGESHIMQEFSLHPDDAGLTVTFKIYSPNNWIGCGKLTPPVSSEQAAGRCVHVVNVHLDPSELRDLPGEAVSWWHTPATEAEAQAMTRWANVHLQLKNAEGAPLTTESLSEAQLLWDQD